MRSGVDRALKQRGAHFMRRGLQYVAAAVALGTGVMYAAPAAVAADASEKQWYLEALSAQDIWKSATGKGIKVAVIDGGVNPATPSLKGQVLPGTDVAGIAGSETDDYDGHGTSMAELIAGTGKGGGLRGLAPDAKIIPIRTLMDEMQKKEAPNKLHTMDKAIRAAADSDAQIINLSLGHDFWDDATWDAVKYAQAKGKLMFAAVGNEAETSNTASYPAAYPEVVGVGATDQAGKAAKFSEHGKQVELAAPGTDIPVWCDKNFQKYCVDGGTSAATALASASAALVWSAHPDWTGNQVLRVLFDTAGRDWKKGTLSNYLGHGIVRPGVNIIRGKGAPGAPDISPVTNKKAPGTSASHAPSSSPSTRAPQNNSGNDTGVAGSAKDAGNDSQLGLVIGATVGLGALAAGAFVVMRRRRGA
jgi:type VII secretion-associated serine protease mycosin